MFNALRVARSVSEVFKSRTPVDAAANFLIAAKEVIEEAKKLAPKGSGALPCDGK